MNKQNIARSGRGFGIGTVLLFWALIGMGGSRVLSAGETVYFLMGRDGVPYQSYVVGVDDPELVAEAREFLRSNHGDLRLIPRAKVALGSDGINRNYADVGSPEWDWHATELLSWVIYDPNLPHAAVVIPGVHNSPSEVPELLRGELSFVPFDPESDVVPQPEVIDITSLTEYGLVIELDPEKEANVVNYSSRAWVGTGERVFISSFIIQGGTPRNVVLRALGPSLADFGVEEVLANPSMVLYRDGEVLAANDDWRSGNLYYSQSDGWSARWGGGLAPMHERDAALKLSLLPGTYSIHVSGTNGAQGIALVDVHDMDALAAN